MHIEPGSTNLYTDIGSHDAEAMQRKAAMISRISVAIEVNGLEVSQAASIIGVDAARLAGWLKGRFRDTDETSLQAGLLQLEIPR